MKPMIVIRGAAALMAAAFACSALAQQAPLDGSRPPVISVADASASSAMPKVPSQVVIDNPGMPVPQGGVSGAGALGEVLPPVPKPKRSFKAPATSMQVEPGKNTTFAIAVGHINRIVTPFNRPALRTTSTASTSIEGSIVYVATEMEDPIGLFVFDESAPEMAISLTLVPETIEPVSTTISVVGWTGADRTVRKPSVKSDALAYEAVHPYLETLTAVLRDVAMGRIPDGYGMDDVSERNYVGAPECRIPGVHVRAMQVLEGSGLKVIVAKATNTSYASVEVNEAMCKGGNLRAAAVWPQALLGVGQSTELYLVVSQEEEVDRGAVRPSVLGVN